jgi:hypothetical protein
MAMCLPPLWHYYQKVIALSQESLKIDRFLVRIFPSYPPILPIELSLNQYDPHPHVLVLETAALVKSYLLLLYRQGYQRLFSYAEIP